ncbi:MAG TPA: outer membrane protein assembly factor BamD [Thermoanaerobaculia bacterium]|jgi:outer membrane protein assembly factor BamD|nr:outer membrane protein assembly factor BamD [Thermoanaerobaculia bacterium]
MKRTLLIFAVAGLALASCKSGGAPNDPILRLGAEESLAQGKELLTREKYDRARPYFTHAFEVEPNSAIGREALLLAADTYYLQGGSTNFVQAEAKYRDFLNRFPTSQQSAYVQFQIANSLAKRMEKPDRDQNVTRKALEAYQELIRLYPTSEYAAQAQEQMNAVLTNLAEHEFQVGRFYFRYGAPLAAVERFEYLLSTYPQYPERDKVIYHLGVSYEQANQPEEARKAFERLRAEYPQSPFLQEIPTELRAGK